MSVDRPSTLPERGPPTSAPAMARRSAAGFAWMLAQTVGSRAFSLIAQVVLARLLLPEHYGQVGLATTIGMLASLLVNPGIEEVLVQRRATLRRWSNAAFWMSVACGLLGGTFMFLAAPVGAWLYHEPGLMGLVWVSALGSAIGAVGVVPTAHLRTQFRFRLLAGVGTLVAVVQAGLSMLLAWLGAGAYSFVIPVPLVMALRVGILWWAVRPPIFRSMQVHRWRKLLPDTFVLFLTRAVGLTISQGDYVILGLLTSSTVVGIYFFAFNLSRQLVQIFAVNMSNVLLPALSVLTLEPRRQLDATLRTARMVALVIVPLSFLQAGLADGLIRLFFGDRWEAAIPVMQVLLVGTAINAPSWVNANLLQAQGRYWLLFWSTVGVAILFLGCIVVGALQGQALGVAYGSSISLTVGSLIGLYVAIRPIGGRVQDVLRIYVFPAIAGLFTISLAMLVVDWIPRIAVVPLARIVCVSVLSGALYLVAVRIFDRAAWQELLGLARMRRVRSGDA